MNEQIPNEQLAEVFGERKEAELDPKLEEVARNVIDCYDFDPEQESFLVVTDTKVMAENPDFLIAVERELEARTSLSPRAKGNYEVLVVPASPYSATPFEEYVGDKMKNRPVLIATSMSRSHSRETAAASQGRIAPKENFDAILESPEAPANMANLAEDPDYYTKLQALAQKTRSRIISMTKGHNPYEILTSGAVEESVESLRERADNVSELMQTVKEVRVTTDKGTDITIKVRVDKSDVEDGRLTEPGKISNYPIGEWSCSIQLEGTNGTLVADIAAGGNHNKDQFDEHGPIALKVESGVVTAISGVDLNPLKKLLSEETDYKLLASKDSHDRGLSKKQTAERQRIQKLVDHYFDEHGLDNPLLRSMLKYWIAGDNPEHHCFRLAEFAVGTNTKACQGKSAEDIGSSEGEKIYGTTHIAVGSNGTFGVKPDDPNFNDCAIHCDMVISEPTIECARRDDSKFKLIEHGQPIDY